MIPGPKRRTGKTAQEIIEPVRVTGGSDELALRPSPDGADTTDPQGDERIIPTRLFRVNANFSFYTGAWRISEIALASALTLSHLPREWPDGVK